MKIFVINMDKSVDRWKRISKELDAKKWYILFVIIVAEILMVLTNF